MVDLKNEGGARQEKLREFDNAAVADIGNAVADLSEVASGASIDVAEVMDAIADLSVVVSELATKE